MRAFWLTYREASPEEPQGWPLVELRRLIRRFEVNPAVTTAWWRLAEHGAARIGDRVYLFRQGKGPRGIFGSGHIVAAPAPPGGDDRAAGGMGCRIRFDRLVDPWARMLVPLESAAEFLPASLVQAAASGVVVPPALVPAIEGLLAAAPGRAPQPESRGAA